MNQIPQPIILFYFLSPLQPGLYEGHIIEDYIVEINEKEMVLINDNGLEEINFRIEDTNFDQLWEESVEEVREQKRGLWKDEGKNEVITRIRHIPMTPLTPYEECVIDLYKKRSNEGDDCIVDCLASGEGRVFVGGCWHTCFAYSGVHKSPSGMKNCKEQYWQPGE